MSLATLLVLSSRRRGRPRADDDPEARKEHIRCTTMLLSGKFTAGELAGMFGVSRRTIYNWRDLALGYDDPEADGLRLMFRR